jgi:hypothetical protein
VVSKCQIMFESKAQADEKAQHTCEYVSILKRFIARLNKKNRTTIPSPYFPLLVFDSPLSTTMDYGLV